MKTLSSAEEDFRAHERDVNRIEDFWSSDVSALYDMSVTRLHLNWARESRRDPGVVGLEELVFDLDDPVAGKQYRIPGQGIVAEYRMATPSKGEGAKARGLNGTLHVVEVTDTEVSVALDLSALMERLDVPGRFDERVQGRFRLARR